MAAMRTWFVIAIVFGSLAAPNDAGAAEYQSRQPARRRLLHARQFSMKLESGSFSVDTLVLDLQRSPVLSQQRLELGLATSRQTDVLR